MIRSLYDYYVLSTFDLEQVLEDYVDNFYLKKHSDDKAVKSIKKSIEIDGMKELYGNSIKNRDIKGCFPKYIDFAKTIKSSLWFSLQSPRTIALGTLAAANEWNNTINSHFYIVDKETFRNNILLIFKEYQIMDNISNAQFDNDNNLAVTKESSFHDICAAEKKQKAKQFEEGIRWFINKTIVDLVVQYDMKRTDPVAKQSLNLAIDTAVASSDIKRIARNLGLDWQEIVDKQIETVLIMRKSSHISLWNSDYGDSIDTIKFLEGFNQTLHSKL